MYEVLPCFFHTKIIGFEYFGEIQYPKFRFGGVEGSTVTTIAFKHKKN